MLLLNKASLNFFIQSFFIVPKFKSLKFKSWIIVDFLKKEQSKSISNSYIGAQDERSNFSILL